MSCLVGVGADVGFGVLQLFSRMSRHLVSWLRTQSKADIAMSRLNSVLVAIAEIWSQMSCW